MRHGRKHGLVIAVGAAAVVVGGLVGCSSDTSSTSTSEETTATTTETQAEGTTEAPATGSAAGATQVTIDGQEQTVEGSVMCTNVGGNVQIAIGNATGGLGAQVTEGDAPQVKQVGLGNVNGVALGYAEGAPGGEATATKDGNTYTITGTATGVDMSNPLEPMKKPFEIVVTCP
ncbi:lipoprotein LpqH [Mycolicibacterium palauense]|uniref:lipoprotein LpqH n=1 Tax=Mycolicibacterium palauense TaxID=2034511 RepID=UPI000BFEAC16|nr:lipoprotein LpqH [Mycolicibacterium palauense]